MSLYVYPMYSLNKHFFVQGKVGEVDWSTRWKKLAQEHSKVTRDF